MAQTQALLPNEIDLYKDITALDMKLDEYIQLFDKSRRCEIGRQISDLCLVLIRYCCLAWRIPEERLYYLRKFEAEYTTLDYLIRKCHKPTVKQLSDKQYLECAQIQARIAKQLSGWIRSTMKNDETKG